MPRGGMVAAGAAAAGVTGLAALAGRYAAGTARAGRSWPAQVEARLRALGEVDELVILPLVERLTPEGSGLRGEPGVSYPGRRPIWHVLRGVDCRLPGRQGGVNVPGRAACRVWATSGGEYFECPAWVRW